MYKYANAEENAILNTETNQFIPVAHYSYDEIIEDGHTVTPFETIEKTAARAAIEAAAESARARKEAQLAGVKIDGVMCSATKEDMWGLHTIREFVKAGNDINFEFKNGNSYLLKPSNIEAFDKKWTAFRYSFFSGAK